MPCRAESKPEGCRLAAGEAAHQGERLQGDGHPSCKCAKKFEKSGFNVGQIQDAIYKDLVTHISPCIGRYTKFLFDKYTRGLMMRSAIEEYTRLASQEPGG